MTLHLIELLTSLISRPSVREVVKMGILPLISTISSYMILTTDIEEAHKIDKNLFIYGKDEDIYKMRNIRNSCLDLMSKLIEDFQDDAIGALIFVIQNLLLTQSKKQSSPSKIKVQGENSKQNMMQEISVYEFSFASKNPNHFWKKREVALVVLGQYAEDIQQFRIRNPSLNLKQLATDTLMIEFEEVQSVSMRSYLKGRSLACAFHLCEIIPRDYADLILAILDMCADFTKNESLISIKLIGIKTLIKYSRKLKD